MINDKTETTKAIDGEDLYKASLYILSNIHRTKKFFKTNKERGQRKIQMCCPALNLLSKCMCFFNASDDLIIQSANEIIFYLHSAKSEKMKPFILNLIFKISYYQPERALSFAQELIKFIFLFASEKTNSTQIIESIFGTLNNMVYRLDEFSIYLPSCSPIFEVQYDGNWSEKSFFNYFRLQDTIFLRMPLCERKEENWQKSILNIRNSVDLIISNGLNYFDLYNFKTKKQFILMICHLFLIDDSEIILRLCPHQDNIIPLFIDHLDCNNITMTFEIAKTLLFLCKKQSIIKSITVIDILEQSNISDIIENIMNEAKIDHDFQIIFNQIQRISQALSES